MKCSICPDREATDESVCNPGTYYCSSCANYVAMEYGVCRLKPIEEKMKLTERETVPTKISFGQDRT